MVVVGLGADRNDTLTHPEAGFAPASFVSTPSLDGSTMRT
jgi:hypothetical protein